MQTILGANGQIANELAKALHDNYTADIRLVSRNPRKINDSDQLFPANLLDGKSTEKAVEGSDIAYLTVGLPIDSSLWEKQFPVMMKNVITACKANDTKLVFFDNTYMYAKTSTPQTEESPFVPAGRKSWVRAKIAQELLTEMERDAIEAVICRAPEFYGPGKTQGVTNALVFENIRQGKKPKVPLTDDTLRTLIWTPDASRAMALIGNSPNAFQQTWHLPCDDNRPTYKDLISFIAESKGHDISYDILKSWMFQVGGWFKKPMKEVQELLPRYKVDNIFVSQKFKDKFPDFPVTSYREGVSQIMQEHARG